MTNDEKSARVYELQGNEIFRDPQAVAITAAASERAGH